MKKFVFFVLLVALVGFGVGYFASSQAKSANLDFYIPWQKNKGEPITPRPLPARSENDPQLRQISLPEGFKIEYFAKNITNARSLSTNADGVVFVGSRKAGNVYAVVDTDNDFVADETYVLASGLNSPNGVAYRDGDLFIAEIDQISVIRDIDDQLATPPKPEILFSDLPSDAHHGWKYINFGPDGLLYIPVGAPCNVCDAGDPYATIVRLDVDNPEAGYEIVARGIRNTVGFDWHPQTNELWFTDNGRDLLGDNVPGDELNRVVANGNNTPHFGYPFCHADDVVDPEFGSDGVCGEYIAPELQLGPHVAALGMLFYEGNQFPRAYRNLALIAEHGSWNRSEKIGYRITSATIDSNGNGASDYAIFAEGWLQGDEAWGRPVDVIQYTDGSILVSDDVNDAIYRIWY